MDDYMLGNMCDETKIKIIKPLFSHYDNTHGLDEFLVSWPKNRLLHNLFASRYFAKYCRMRCDKLSPDSIMAVTQYDAKECVALSLWYIPMDENLYKKYSINTNGSVDAYDCSNDEVMIDLKDLGLIETYKHNATDWSLYDLYNDLFLEAFGLATKNDNFALETQVDRQFIAV
jgi:hypothetical protein